MVRPLATDDESEDVRWLAVEDMDSVPLLSYFKQDWANFEQRLNVVAREQRV